MSTSNPINENIDTFGRVYLHIMVETLDRKLSHFPHRPMSVLLYLKWSDRNGPKNH